MMDLDQLRLFADLVREQNYTKAAKLICVTQPAVRRSIRRVEEAFGVKRLQRSTRKVLATEGGRLVYEHAREILTQAGAIKRALQKRQEEVLDTVRLAGVPTVGLSPLRHRLRRASRAPANPADL